MLMRRGETVYFYPVTMHDWPRMQRWDCHQTSWLCPFFFINKKEMPSPKRKSQLSPKQCPKNFSVGKRGGTYYVNANKNKIYCSPKSPMRKANKGPLKLNAEWWKGRVSSDKPDKPKKLKSPKSTKSTKSPKKYYIGRRHQNSKVFEADSEIAQKECNSTVVRYRERETGKTYVSDSSGDVIYYLSLIHI